jgi:hypothetical protein
MIVLIERGEGWFFIITIAGTVSSFTIASIGVAMVTGADLI